MTIRQLTFNDVPAMCALWCKMLLELGKSAGNVEWYDAETKMFMEHMKYFAFGAFEGTLVGYVDGFIYPDPQEGTIIGQGRGFYVYPEFRKRVPGYLLYRIVKEFKKNFIDSFELIAYPNSLPIWAGRKGFSQNKFILQKGV